ncbi:leucine--tRNA ligase, partial [Candidatus Heimdallarchaeota archaeon]
TIYGATNVWIHPEADYLEIRIDGENWIVSKESTSKLMEQDHDISIVREVKGKDFVNLEVTVPITEARIPIYPATFVDTNHATGVVYSVPAHAPYDYAALVDLQNDEVTIKEYSLDRGTLEKIKPISLISVKGYGEFPAVELCEMLDVKTQNDKEKLEKATQTIYKDEYYSGVMKDNTGKFKGLKVEEAKNAVAKTLSKNNQATVIYETSKKALCRCGGQIIVAVLQDQYFLNYGDKKWKETAFKALNKMLITPNKYRQTFENTFNWLDKRPCVRKRGLGTEFPLTKGEGWIIESLSDSVIYMAFYTIIKTIREKGITPEQLTPELFDYVYLNEGKPKDISEITEIPLEIIEEMKDSFEYYYPNDLRHTAIAHISNHLSFAIFHHVAIFPEKYWLPAFSLNEILIREGQKMGKSKGNVIPIAHIPKKYSVDLTRLHLASVATADTVVDWRETEVSYALQRLRKFWEYANRSIDVYKTVDLETAFPSKILRSTIKNNLYKALKSIEEFNIRDYVLEGFYGNIRAIDEYIKVADHLPRNERETILREAIEDIIVIMAPVIPHISEEIHHKMGNESCVSLKQFPEITITEEDKENALQAKFISNLLEDIDEIVKLVKTKPQKIHIYINSDWKNELYELAKELFEGEAVKIGKIMESSKEHKNLVNHMKEIAEEAKQMLKDPSIFRIEMLSAEKQKNAIEGYKEFISRTYIDAEIHIHVAGDKKIYDPKNKASKARPMRPALLLE